MKRKVCIFTTVHSVFDNRVFYKEAKTLAGAGYEVVLIARHLREEVVNGIRILPLPLSENRFKRMMTHGFNALFLGLKQRADVYHFHDPELIPIGLILRLLGKRVIYDVHENVPDDVRCKNWIPKNIRNVVSKSVDLLERLAARFFTAVITADDKIAARFSENRKPVLPIYNYPVLEEFSSTSAGHRMPQSSGCIANFGGISPERSIYSLVRAMELLPKDLGLKMVLCGSCDSQSLLDDVSSMPGWDCIEYRGHVKRAEMVHLLSHSTAAVILYSPLPNHMDIRSNRLYESMAAGLPVITSNFPQWETFIKNARCGLTVPPNDAQAIANAILYLHIHAEEAVAMGSRGRQVAFNQFNWTVEASKLLSLYSGLLGVQAGMDKEQISSFTSLSGTLKSIAPHCDENPYVASVQSQGKS